jgi:GxxExxY protein
MLLEEKLTEAIRGALIEVHRALGPGLLESTYEACLCHELNLRGLKFEKQVDLPVAYKGVLLDCGYRMDLLIEGRVVLELKCVDCLHPIHRAQVLTYLRLSGHKVALLVNFNVALMIDGIERIVLERGPTSSSPLRASAPPR